eukprot:gene19795-23475_t
MIQANSNVATKDTTVSHVSCEPRASSRIQRRHRRWLWDVSSSVTHSVVVGSDDHSDCSQWLSGNEGHCRAIASDNGPPSPLPPPSSSTNAEDTAAAEALFVLTTKSGAERKRKSEERLCYELIGKWRLSGYVLDTVVDGSASAAAGAGAAGGATTEEIDARAHRFADYADGSSRFVVLHVTFSAVAKALGMGVKAATDGAVYVTSF